ncbi:MAG: efflux RND transporter periplasmic adaptor subunit [Planctomycetota bacterium]|nr:efflux RND transporter periplasmic adaptor subunit [Planctomycetota bacterium]
MTVDRKSLDGLRIDRSRAPRRGPSAATVLSLIVLAGAGAGVYWWLNRPPVAVVRTVAAVEPKGSADRTRLNASGYVTARRAATVSSKVTGKVMEVLVEEGKKVQKDQVLARLDSSNVERSLRLSEAQLESAKKALGETQANLEQSRRELVRLKQLLAQQAATQRELDRGETEVKSLEARLARQTADIGVSERERGLWEQQLDDTIIRAPFAGMVTSKNAQPGEMISPMSVGGFTRTGICTIVDMTSLEIEVDVSESYINRVQPAQPVTATLDSYPDWEIPAHVIAIIPTADRQKATVKVRVGFDKLDPRILPDMSVKAAFRDGDRAGDEPAATQRQRGMTVPKAAVRQVDGRDVVWVVREGRVERRAVTLGPPPAPQAGAAGANEQVAIAAGLSGGERVVVEGADKLVDGANVTEKQ